MIITYIIYLPYILSLTVGPPVSLTIGADSPDSTAGVVVVGSVTSPASSGSVMIGSVSTADAVVTGAGGDVVTCACSVVVAVVVVAAMGM